MRMFAREAAFYRRAWVDETNDAEALRRLKELEAADRMRERFTLSESLSALGVGWSMCYDRKRRLREEGVRGLIPRNSRPKSCPGRQWTMTDAKRVLDARRKMPWAMIGPVFASTAKTVGCLAALLNDEFAHGARLVVLTTDRADGENAQTVFRAIFHVEREQSVRTYLANHGFNMLKTIRAL